MFYKYINNIGLDENENNLVATIILYYYKQHYVNKLVPAADALLKLVSPNFLICTTV